MKYIIKAQYVFSVSLKISRKHDRQLGNHSLFTVGLAGEGWWREGGGWGLNWELSAGPMAGRQGRF